LLKFVGQFAPIALIHSTAVGPFAIAISILQAQKFLFAEKKRDRSMTELLITLSFVLALLDKRYFHDMEGIHQKISRQNPDSGDMPHPRPSRTDSDQDDVELQSEGTKETPSGRAGKIPRQHEKVVGGKRHLQRTSRTQEDDDFQSKAELTPGAFAVDSVNSPNEDDDTFDIIPKPLDRTVTSASRPVLNTQPSATKIVAHLADDSEIEARIAEKLEREMKESGAIIVATQVKKDEETVLVCGLHQQTVWKLVVLLLLVVGGIVGGVVYSLGNDDASAPTQLDTSAPGPTPVPAQLDPLVQELKPWIAPTEEDLLPFNEPTSPQSRALDWLNKDPITMSTGRAASVVLQRYVLAVFYFSTNGDRWDDSYNFMSDADFCTWNNSTDPENGGRGVFCSTDDEIVDWVDLGGNNLQSPTLPSELFLLTNLKHINLGYNRVGGIIPTRTGELTKLDYFDLSKNKLKGPLPTTMPSTMTYLDLSSNVLNGTIPSSWGERMPKLQKFFLERNQLTGSLPTTMPPTLTFLDLSSNNLTGTIPSSWGESMPELQYFYLEHNQLTGPLPTTFPSTLIYLWCSSNYLTGSIP
jgi:Leucine Rich repeats (2 copies)